MEIKRIRLPDQPARVEDERRCQVTDLTPYVGLRIKRTKRIGREILAILEGPRKGARGIILIFASFDDFDRCVARSLNTNT